MRWPLPSPPLAKEVLSTGRRNAIAREVLSTPWRNLVRRVESAGPEDPPFRIPEHSYGESPIQKTKLESSQDAGQEQLPFRISRVPSELHSSPGVFRPERTDSPSTSVQKKKKVLDDEDVLNLLEDIKVDLDFANAEAEYADDSSNDSTARNLTPKTRKGKDYYAKRGSNLSSLEQLPLSPLMHPRLLEARGRFAKAKPLPSEELNEFQRLININPYAKVLATPVRVCVLTRVRLPNSFFIPFTLKKDSRTGRLWQIPTGLVDHADQPMTSKGDTDGSVIRHEPTELSFRENKETMPISLEREDENRSPTNDTEPIPPTAAAKPTSPTDQLPAPQPSDRSPLPPLSIRKINSLQFGTILYQPPAVPPTLQKVYLLSSHAALTHVGALSRGPFTRLLPYRWKGHFGESLKTSVWREDMADFVLKLLRKRVVSWLLSVESLVPVSDWQVKEGWVPGDVAAVLWMRDLWSGLVRSKMGDVSDVSEPPLGAVARAGGVGGVGRWEKVDGAGKVGGLASVSRNNGEGETKRVEGATVPVFNLALLLGEEGMGELWRGKGAYYHRRRHSMQGLEKNRLSARLVGMLWSLVRYVGDGEVEVREWAVRSGRGGWVRGRGRKGKRWEEGEKVGG